MEYYNKIFKKKHQLVRKFSLCYFSALFVILFLSFYRLPIATFFMCIGVTQILGILLVMGVGALYGIVFIGKK